MIRIVHRTPDGSLDSSTEAANLVGVLSDPQGLR
jgi:hypothetical protein